MLNVYRYLDANYIFYHYLDKNYPYCLSLSVSVSYLVKFLLSGHNTVYIFT